MPGQGHYQGSVAFSHGVPDENESVNPNTASLNFAVPLIKLRGVRTNVDLGLSMLYMFGTSGTFGLPEHWGLDLPYVVDDLSVTTRDGRTFALDRYWADATGHESGLRYMNHHGVKFRRVEPPLPLPSGLPGRYGYRLDQADGSTDYFDRWGKPVEYHDTYGNFLRYQYSGGVEAGVDNPYTKLDHVQDSWGNKVTFKYTEGRIIEMTLPDGAVTRTDWNPQEGIKKVTDAAGFQTNIEYKRFAADSQHYVISAIKYPTGLVSTYEYAAVRALDEAGQNKWIPAVEKAVQLDGRGGKLSHTTYKLSEKTYTGASFGARLGGITDPLMEGNGEAARHTYDVTQTSYDEKEGIATQVKTWYNNYHLPIRQTRYSVDDHGKPVPAYRTIYKYNIPSDKRARTPAYNYPVDTEVWHATGPAGGGGNEDDEGMSWAPMTHCTAEYNAFGNLVESTEELHEAERGYVGQMKIENEYATTPHNTQITTKSTRTDEVAGTAEQTVSTLTADERNVKSATLSFSARSTARSALRPWTKRTFTYDDRGRQDSEELTWSPGATAPEGTPSSVTNRIVYTFDEAGGILKQQGHNALGKVTTLAYDMRRNDGPLVSKTLPLGQTERFEHDEIGRLKSHTDALGHVTTTTYIVGPDGGSESVRGPTGYIKRSLVDVLGREVSALDNGDPTDDPEDKDLEPTRVLSATKYDLCSRISESTDSLGLTTKYTYDALDRPLAVTDPKGNVTLHTYDDVKLTVTQTINGNRRTVSQQDGRGDDTQVVTYPDSDDSLTTYLIVEDTVFDGSRRKLSNTTSQRPKSSGDQPADDVELQNEVLTYSPGSAILSRTVTGRATTGGQDVLARHYTLDLFDNVYTWVKETSYAGHAAAVLTHQGPVHIFDADNRLTRIKNQLGQEEVNTYDDNGWLETSQRHDGSVVRFKCNAEGQFIEETHGSGTKTEFRYDATGQLSHIIEGSQTMTYDASLDGTLTKVTYPDGKSQRYVPDRHSRAVEEYDVFGVCRRTKYSAQGEVETRSCNGDVVTYTYGMANHTHGQPTGYSVTGKRPHSITLTYDGFYRLARTTTNDPQGKTLLQNDYGLDALGRATSINTRSAVSPNLDSDRTMEYDGLGQLVTDKRSTGGPAESTYTYDGNFNVKSKVVDGRETKLTYNAIDQRADAGFEYDPNGRLTKDDTGSRYHFDDRDRLISVETGDGAKSEFGYHTDGYLANRTGATDSVALFHSSGRFNAFSVTGGSRDGPQQTSLFSGAPSMTATYTQDQSESSYLFNSLGSTALVMAGQDQVQAEGVVSSTTYDAYGRPATTPGKAASTAASEVASSFGFAQEFTDKASGLVYLRSRYYNPHQMSFLSMDRNHQENRYAYCDGDPINNVDPLGLFWKKLWGGIKSAWNKVKKWVGIAVGTVVAVAVTAATAGLAAPLIGAVAAGVIGGVVGGIAGGAVNAAVSGGPYGWKEALVDGLVGGVGGGVGAGLFSSAGKAAVKETAKWTLKQGAKKIVTSGLKGMAVAVAETQTRATARAVVFGEPLNPVSMAIDIGVGFLSGAAGRLGDKLGKQVEGYSTRGLARAGQHISRNAPGNLGRSINMAGTALDLPGFSGGIPMSAPSASSSSSSRPRASDVSSSTLTRRVATLHRHDGAHGIDDLPLHIVGL